MALFRPLLAKNILTSSARAMTANFSSQSRPLIAVVATPGCPSLDHMPKNPACDVVFTGQTSEELDAQAEQLSRATGMLYIASPGNPSAPSDILNNVWPRLPNVTWVHSFMAGVDGLRGFMDASLIPAADRVNMSNGRGAFSSSLAEYALTAMLHFNKQIPRCQEQKKNRIWHNFVMDVMANKTIGLVGYGSIGTSCGRAAKAAFGSRIIALRNRVTEESDDLADRFYSLDQREEFFGQCDFVIAALPSTPTTQKFIGEKELAAMKDTTVLVSIGRGATIDEAALEHALRTGVIRGAALDVFAKEPLSPESGFWDLDNVLLTAHNADFTEDYFELGWNVWEQNLAEFAAGKPLATPVDIRQGY